MGFRNKSVPSRNGGTLYFLAVDDEAVRTHAWTDGAVYVLPAGPFARAETAWVSRTPVRPLARLVVSPADFPLLGQVWGLRRSCSTSRTSR